MRAKTSCKTFWTTGLLSTKKRNHQHHKRNPMRIRLLTAVLYSDWWSHCFKLLGLFAQYSTETDSGSSSKESYNCITFFLWRSYCALTPNPNIVFVCYIWIAIQNELIYEIKILLFLSPDYSHLYVFKIFYIPIESFKDFLTVLPPHLSSAIRQIALCPRPD